MGSVDERGTHKLKILTRPLYQGNFDLKKIGLEQDTYNLNLCYRSFPISCIVFFEPKKHKISGINTTILKNDKHALDDSILYQKQL